MDRGHKHISGATSNEEDKDLNIEVARIHQYDNLAHLNTLIPLMSSIAPARTAKTSAKVMAGAEAEAEAELRVMT